MPEYGGVDGWYTQTYRYTSPSFTKIKTPKPDPVKKHIKYTAQLIPPDFKNVRVVITEQTHRNNNFGDQTGWGGSSRFDHNGFCLRTYMRPTVSAYTLVSNSVYLRGLSKEEDSRPLVMSLGVYSMFRDAVQAYNSHFSGDKEKEEEAQKATVADGKKKARGELLVDREAFLTPQKAEAKPEPWRDKDAWRRFYR